MALVVRLADAGGSRAMGLVPSLVHQVAPSLPLTDVEPLEHLVERDVASLRLTSWLLTCLALAALGLAATGAYGTIWSLTLSHLREMRIRFALGARAWHLVRQSLAVLGPWLVAGVAGGALGAYLLSGLLRNQLFAVGFADPRLIAVLALLLGLLGAGGLLIPLSYHRRLDATSLLRG
jgi:hypothetical protein